MSGEGFREAMTGTVALYNSAGERLHTIYLGAAPEYGKSKFLERFEQEIYAIKLQYPGASYVGIADGADTAQYQHNGQQIVLGDPQNLDEEAHPQKHEDQHEDGGDRAA